MFDILSNRTYRHLFSAQVVALLGTGLATVALSLMAFELGDQSAGAIVGTALTIKMLAYVFVSPLATAFIRNLPRRAVLIALDLIRAGVALFLPFVSEVWHLFVLIFLLQASSACFTPLFQATIPDVLPDQKEYTKALSLSRLAYDLENLLSPALAAILLTLVTWHGLFTGTVIGFLASACLVASCALPKPAAQAKHTGSVWQKTTRGIRFYLATPRLRGLLALTVAVTAAGSMVIVNTVVQVQADWGLSEQATALALAGFGAGSMCAALLLPRALEHIADRTLMLAGALILVPLLFAGSFLESFGVLLLVWFLLGVGYATVQTPAGRLLTRSSHQEDRPDLFAAQFSLSHAVWLVAYPSAGFLGLFVGLSTTFLIFALVALASCIAAIRLWPAEQSDELLHEHPDLPADHEHLSGGSQAHRHSFVIDDLHQNWPR